MRITLTVAAAATSLVILGTPASAQNADARSFLHPLGFWSNDRFVAQPRVYPLRLRVPHYDSDPELSSPGNGGYVLHERNW